MLKFSTYNDLLENEGLKKKAEKSGISLGTLKKVYNRGMAAWKTGHRPGTTPQQWAHARVNSYITKGKGTYYGADSDLSGKGKKESVDEAKYDYFDSKDAAHAHAKKHGGKVYKNSGKGATMVKGKPANTHVVIKDSINKEGTVVKEGAEEEATLVMAAKDMVDRITGWMEDTAEMQTESMLELGDKIRDELGIDKSDEFIGAVKPALEGLYSTLEGTRNSLTTGVAVLTGEGAPTTMGDEIPADDAEMDMEPTVDAEAEPDAPEGEDEFAAADASAGGEEEAGREKRESVDLSKRLGLLLADSKKKS